MEASSRSLTKEPDVVRVVKVKEDKKLCNVERVKEREEWCKCFKWVQECINKFKRIVISVREREK
jgi:hypothetical protein